MSSKKRKKAQERILGEIRSQLTIKAKKLGISDQFEGIKFEEMKLEAAKKILDQLNSEKSALEYELYMKGKLDRDSTIKLEKIQTYINKALRVIGLYDKTVAKAGEKTAKALEKGREAAKKMTPSPRISISR